jgi:arylsulfatase A-like enzyme
LGYLPLLFGYTDSAHDPRTVAPNDPVLKSYEEVMTGFHEVVRLRLEDDAGPWRADLIAKGYAVPPYPGLYQPAGPEIDDPAVYSAQDSDTAFLTDRVIEDLSARPAGWFAHVTYIRPHPPFVAPAPYNRMYDSGSLPTPFNTLSAQSGAECHPFVDLSQKYAPFHRTIVGFPDIAPSAENVAKVRATYLGLASEVDHHVGRLIQFLKDSGQYDETLIVVTSDHGEMLGDYGTWGKSTFYDASYKTALIVRDPTLAGKQGKVCDAPTESVDVTPTILECLGAEIPHSMDGHSLRPLLDGATPEGWREYTFSELEFGNPVHPTIWQEKLGLGSDDTNLAILRTKSHRLVHFAGDLPQVLFDMTGDGERRDVAQNKESAPIRLELTEKMLRHRMRNPDGLFARTMVTNEGVLTR